MCFEYSQKNKIDSYNHPHDLIPTFTAGFGWICDKCGFSGTPQHTRFNCSTCNFDLCLNCRFIS